LFRVEGGEEVQDWGEDNTTRVGRGVRLRDVELEGLEVGKGEEREGSC